MYPSTAWVISTIGLNGINCSPLSDVLRFVYGIASITGRYERVLRIAYFTNQYPKVSHTFIRREIEALERQGVDILRLALKSDRTELVDHRDIEEFEKTIFVLTRSPLALVVPCIVLLLSNPRRWFRALKLSAGIGWRSDRGLVRNLAYFVEACILARLAAAQEIQHIHAHFGTNSAAITMLARELSGIPYSITVHGPEEFDRPASLCLSEKIHRADFVVGVSSFGRSQLLRWTRHEEWHKIKVVHCGVDREFHQVELSEVPEVPSLVCVGRLCEQKGQLLLLQAVGALVKEGTDVQLRLVGDGPMRPEVDRLVDELGLGSRVAVTGWLSSDDVRAEILNARALVLPSFAEGLPVVIMEAMALGRSALSTYVAGIPELVRPGDTGWLVPAGNVDLLKEAIREVLATPIGDLRAMGERARARVLDRHDVDAGAAKLVRYFEASIAAQSSQ